MGDAHETLQSIIQREPTYGRAYNHLGWMYETQYKDYRKAEEYYKLAMQYAPEYVPLYLNYAICLSIMERFSDLKELLEKALQVPGVDKHKIYNEYGIMCEMQGDFENAIDYYRKAINASLNNNDLDIYQESIDRCIKKRGR